MSPFCPIYPWLDACTLSLAPIDPPFNVSDLAVDCRDIGNRLAILQTLAVHNHRYPWALGGIWSTLTDEQAGRVVAEIVRRIGPDIQHPMDIRPVVVMSEWVEGDKLYAHIYRGEPALTWRQTTHGCGHRINYACLFASCWFLGPWPQAASHYGPETGIAGKIAADVAARRSGALLWEDITP